MKIFLNYITFSQEEAEKLIRNESNNDHWPTANSYLDQLKKWLVEMDKQQAVVKDYLQYLTTAKVSSESFVIRIVNDINTKIKALNAKDNKGNYYLDRTLDIEAEIANLRNALDFPEYPAFKEQLRNWNEDSAASLNKIRKIFAGYQLGQWETIHDHFKQWNENRTYPIREVGELLEAWEINNYKIDSQYQEIEQIKSLQIQLLERTNDFIRFAWRVPLQKVEDDEQSEKVNRIFPNIKNYLFCLNGEYYEVSEWKQTDWETVEIVAEKNIFYNGYWGLIKAAANGWVHHSPVGKTIEVCNCQTYDYFDSRNDFICDYELRYDVWRIGKEESKNKTFISSGGFSMIYCGLPSLIGGSDEEVDAEYEKIDSAWNKFWAEAWGRSEEIIYILLNAILKPGKGWFAEQTHLNSKWKRVGKYNESRSTNDLENFDHKDFLKDKGLLKDEMFHCLEQHIKATIFWRNKSVWEGNYWLLHNNLFLLESVTPSGSAVKIFAGGLLLAEITELVTSQVAPTPGSGWLSTLVSVGTTIASAYFTGGMMPLGKKATSEARRTRAVTKAGIESGIKGTEEIGRNVVNNLMSSVAYGETKESYSAHEFKHRFMLGGVRPLSMRLEWNQQTFNQYQKNKGLFGVYRNDTFNVGDLGKLLNNEGFCKLIINSWRLMGSNYSEWFKEKLEEGVFLEKNYGNTKNIELSEGKEATSQGALIFSSWNEVEVLESLKVMSGWDDISDKGDGFWVYKNSPERRPHKNIFGDKRNGLFVYQGPYHGTNLFPDLMKVLNNRFNFINRENSNMWIVKHPGYTFRDYKWNIPDKYKTKEIDGKKYCQIHYLLDFFTAGDGSGSGDELYAEYFLVSKLERGNQSKLTIEIKGHLILNNRAFDPSNIPPAGTLPINPLAGGAQTSNPLNIQGTVPPGSQTPISIVPSAGGGLSEMQVFIDTETNTEQPPEIGTQMETIIDTEAEEERHQHQDTHTDTQGDDNIENER
jgi:hypothetical protein